MYARVSTAEVHPGRMEEVISVMKDSILPAAKWQQGYDPNPETNEAIVVTLCESREAPESGEASGYYREQLGKLG